MGFCACGIPVANCKRLQNHNLKLPLVLRAISIACAALFCFGARAVSFTELHNDATLTPQTFAHHFSKFRFAFHPEVQKPADFLRAEAGDCDDYSTLAASELSARGYHPRLVAVRMKGLVHVICYVAEANGYLDYNKRAHGSGLVTCGADLSQIADSVAKSFKATWTSVSEFTYGDGVKRLVSTTTPKTQLAHR
jgi:hypothetical protein